MAQMCLLVLSGIPGAGKTTWVHNFIEFVHKNEMPWKTDFGLTSETTNEGRIGVIHICYDELTPKHIETRLICNSKSQTDEKAEISNWKAYRRTIVSCVSDLIEELSQEVTINPVSNRHGCPANDDSERKDAVTKRLNLQKIHEAGDTVTLGSDFSEGSLDSSELLSSLPSEKSENRVDSVVPRKTDISRTHLNSEIEDGATRAHEEDASLFDSLELVSSDLRQLFKSRVRQQMKKTRFSSVGQWVLVIDDNMYYSSMRYEFYQLARKYSLGFAQLHFPIDVKTSVERNLRRENRVEESIIHEMANKLEPPETDNSWEKRTASWVSDDSVQGNLENILHLVDEAMRNPEVPLSVDTLEANESRLICSANLLHQADVVLRKILGSYLSDTKDFYKSKTERSTLAGRCNSVRLKILEDLRNESLLDVPVSAFDGQGSSSSSVHPENPFYLFLKNVFNQRLPMNTA